MVLYRRGFRSARLYSMIVKPGWRGRGVASALLRAAEESARERGQTLGVMPAVDRGELFFQDNANIYAVNLDSGLPLPGWATTYPEDPEAALAAAPVGSPSRIPVQNARRTCCSSAVLAIPDPHVSQGVATTPRTQAPARSAKAGRVGRGSDEDLLDGQGGVRADREGGRRTAGGHRTGTRRAVPRTRHPVVLP